jgi:hypothetical protein
MINHSKDGFVIRLLMGKLMDNDNDNKQVFVSSLQTGCTYKLQHKSCVKL